MKETSPVTDIAEPEARMRRMHVHFARHRRYCAAVFPVGKSRRIYAISVDHTGLKAGAFYSRSAPGSGRIYVRPTSSPRSELGKASVIRT